MAKKFICTVCGYVYEGETAPENAHSAVFQQANSKN